jgi:serine/threonine protein kinase
MDRYKILESVGDGTYGSVARALNKNTEEIVAIKKMKQKYFSWDEWMSLREIKTLRKLSHKNIVKLKEVIRVKDDLYLIFEFMEKNVYQRIQHRTEDLPEKDVKIIIYQSLAGLDHMHRHGFFHRDLKPENLLWNGDIVKLGDFGLAREIKSDPPFTDYVSTRWYRAPEILLRSTNYSYEIDIFALGAIMAELYMLRPLYPGKSEMDQIYKLWAVLGSPSKLEWPEGHELAADMDFEFPRFRETPLESIIKNASEEGIDLMKKMMKLNPKDRPTAKEWMEHPYFDSIRKYFEPTFKATPKTQYRGTHLN